VVRTAGLTKDRATRRPAIPKLWPCADSRPLPLREDRGPQAAFSSDGAPHRPVQGGAGRVRGKPSMRRGLQRAALLGPFVGKWMLVSRCKCVRCGAGLQASIRRPHRGGVSTTLNWLLEPECSQTGRNGLYPQIGLCLKP